MQPLGNRSHCQCWKNPRCGTSHPVAIEEEEKDLTAQKSANQLHIVHGAWNVTSCILLCSARSMRGVLSATFFDTKQELHIHTTHDACHACDVHCTHLQVLKCMIQHPECHTFDLFECTHHASVPNAMPWSVANSLQSLVVTVFVTQHCPL